MGKFFLPTEVIYDDNVIEKNKDLFSILGKKVLIVTGRHSARVSGAYRDVINVLKEYKIKYFIFDEVEENPSIETLQIASAIGKIEKVDFVIGIGGGSPLDAAKAISVMIKSDCEAEDLFKRRDLKHLPVVAIPTTSGTGSETTQYSIITIKEKGTKRSILPAVFPTFAFLDVRYTESLKEETTINTAIDALSHLVEGMFTKRASIYSDSFGEKGLRIFKECKDALVKKEFTKEIREKLMFVSNLAGMQIAHSGTSFPHFFGYLLTIDKGIPHGKANGLLLKEFIEFFKFHPNQPLVLELLGFDSPAQFGKFIDEVFSSKEYLKETFSEDDIERYSKQISDTMDDKPDLKSILNSKDIKEIYSKSLLRKD
ncbi:MAG: iron-containing alcohol dehydrogenase family protein [Clostridiaceae bacterium]